MAIYCFDGTGCTPGTLSNVFRMYEAYQSQHKYYSTGPGARGLFGSKLYEKLTGHGAKERLEDAFEVYIHWQERASRETVIIGFSRGAVMAREFSNMVNDVGGKVDFLGLFDSVGSFGNPLDMIDTGYRKDVTSNVVLCAHAMAIHEKRFSFRVVRVNPDHKNYDTTINEVWFDGTHSDIGGVLNKSIGASVLSWMFSQAIEAGVCQWSESDVARYHSLKDVSFSPTKNRLSAPRWLFNRFRTRKVQSGDSVYSPK